MRLIDGDALEKFLKRLRRELPKESRDFFTRDEMILNFQQYVHMQPTIDAMPVVRGEWGFRSNGHNITRIGDYEEWHECSVCKLSADYPSSYCPNCGAKMGGKP